MKISGESGTSFLFGWGAFGLWGVLGESDFGREADQFIDRVRLIEADGDCVLGDFWNVGPPFPFLGGLLDDSAKVISPPLDVQNIPVLVGPVSSDADTESGCRDLDSCCIKHEAFAAALAYGMSR